MKHVILVNTLLLILAFFILYVTYPLDCIEEVTVIQDKPHTPATAFGRKQECRKMLKEME